MFNLYSKFPPTGDQPQAIEKLIDGLYSGKKHQTLLGITGSGKTFTIANVIKQYSRPTVILSHNKTLAAQLFNELKALFPDNCVEYYVSYYDYFKPESYLPAQNIYLAKTLKINNDLEKLRMRAIVALLSGRTDIIIVSSVSCIYGVENPQEFKDAQYMLSCGERITKEYLISKLQDLFYYEGRQDIKRGQYRDTDSGIDIFISHEDYIYRVLFSGSVVVDIICVDPLSGQEIASVPSLLIVSTKLFGLSQDKLEEGIKHIQRELHERILFFERLGKHQEAQRINERTCYDIQMMREIGYCSGIENYSMYFEHRQPGQRSACLFDYFQQDFLTVIDESHVTLPQFKAMYEGDRKRKKNLIDNGFRLPSAYEHRPLRFDEFEALLQKTIYVSATPNIYELQKSGGEYVEQIIRPTGLLDPIITVRPTKNQMQEIIQEIHQCVEKGERVFITTLTKKMAEELNDYLVERGIKSQYLHSSVKTLERVKVLDNIQKGVIDVIVGVNLLREGLDIPEVALVMIVDADKEGFLRNETSLIQTIGRAARNINGRVILFADIMTDSMRMAITTTERRRTIQMQYNKDHNITPKTTRKIAVENFLVHEVNAKTNFNLDEERIKKMTDKQFAKFKKKMEKEMDLAANRLDFLTADKIKQRLEALEVIRKNSIGNIRIS
ncbi:MAG: excinuclease ABC subunit UvrB [Cytophagales bacterium]|nr:excinuclease ABC subunit UvrB [Cytophagales bacterium]